VIITEVVKRKRKKEDCEYGGTEELKTDMKEDMVMKTPVRI
jgi:hypothetical protein